MICIKPKEFLGDAFILFQETCLEAGCIRRVEGHKKYYLISPELFNPVHTALQDSFEIEIHPKASKVIDEQSAQLVSEEQRLKDMFARLEGCGLNLAPFQREDILRISHERALLDRKDPGLGKTVTDVLAIPCKSRVLIITLASVKYNYAEEVTRWRAPFEEVKPRVIDKTLDGMTFGELPDWQVYNYERLPSKRWCETVFPKLCPEGLILIVDEAQKASHENTQIYAKVKAICHAVLDKGGKVILATGTPMQNHPGELWNVLDLARLSTRIFGTKKNFVRLFGGIEGEYGIVWGHPLPEVPHLLSKHCIIRHKRECLPDLPPYRIQHIPVKLGKNTKRFDEAWGVFAQRVAEGIPLEQALQECEAGKLSISFEEFSKVRGELSRLKIEAMKELVRNHLESGTPLVVASDHLSPLYALQEMEEGAGPWGDMFPIIEGKTKAPERKRILDDFQAGKYPVLGISIRAAGTGTNMDYACTMLLVDLHLNPSINRQLMDRIDRFTQKNPMLYQILVGSHPLDLHTVDILIGKEKRIEQTWKGRSLKERILSLPTMERDRLIQLINMQRKGIPLKRTEKVAYNCLLKRAKEMV